MTLPRKKRKMSLNLLTSVVESKWAIRERSLEAILEIVQDHSAMFERGAFHGSDDSMQAAIGTVGSRMDGTRFSTRAGATGILHIDGPIIPRSINTPSAGPSASLEAFSKELKAMDDDPRIENIVLSFDTPGGIVTGVSEFADMVKSLDTPTTGFVYGYAASAGYWIASAVDTLYMSKTAEVGSIGTVAIYEDRSEADARKGVKRFELVSNLSPNKRLGPDTEEGKAATIKILDEITELFVGDVAAGRNVSSEDVMSKFGQGSMFIGQEAVDLGMADGITTLQSLVTSLNNKQSHTNAEGLMSTQANSATDNVVLSAEDVKTQHPSAYEAIYSAGISAEQERLKSIESLKDTDSSVASFVDSKKFESGMTKEKMALSIFEGKEAIVQGAATANAADGEALANAIESIPAATDTAQPEEASEEEQSDSLVADMIAGAKQSLKTSHNLELES